ncbi:MAG: mechanosensitive ion channel, partial [Chitinivibrionales bacterium]|nr:mechanosensitive ion channel [Chitinivibrionales bacterium]
MPMLTERLSSAFELLTEKLASWLEQSILILPNLAVALLVMALAGVVGIVVHRLSKRILSRFLRNLSLVSFLSTLARLCVLVAGAIVALNVLQLEKAVLSVLTGVGILGIALGFAFQDMAANFISGIALVLRDDKPFKVGDVVETGGHI